MSIRQLVEDAEFLRDRGRALGAMSILLLAVAGTSRKEFPEGTRSRRDANAEMTDGEAYVLFLKQRLRTMLVVSDGGEDIDGSGVKVRFRGRDFDVAYILYKFYRCKLAHLGELPGDVQFAPVAEGRRFPNPSFDARISEGDVLRLGHGWIDLLLSAVREARCNATEFGLVFREMVFEPHAAEPEFLVRLRDEYGQTDGRIRIVKDLLRLLTSERVDAMSDEELRNEVFGFVESGRIITGAVVGLSSRGLMNRAGVLQPSGIRLLREMAAGYRMVEQAP